MFGFNGIVGLDRNLGAGLFFTMMKSLSRAQAAGLCRVTVDRASFNCDHWHSEHFWFIQAISLHEL